MHPQTYAIAHFETEEDAKRAGHTEMLTKDEANHLIPKNRKQRRAELKRLRAVAKRKSKTGQRG